MASCWWIGWRISLASTGTDRRGSKEMLRSSGGLVLFAKLSSELSSLEKVKKIPLHQIIIFCGRWRCSNRSSLPPLLTMLAQGNQLGLPSPGKLRLIIAFLSGRPLQTAGEKVKLKIFLHRRMGCPVHVTWRARLSTEVPWLSVHRSTLQTEETADFAEVISSSFTIQRNKLNVDPALIIIASYRMPC
ncbi:hypothetical protein TEQG_05921 [Trichophyton equinum CBS 127.97]|uniref:Uncharacterized protein n=1 Tax=Trichophyton equinum (strain ATCC MYA-4606 / CBS 127.97) TaxID=559882 RepID=F2PY98_TRIEC|nr:hypothetical protein TEQG_05921 [Trichophyton equinum CBS 127.97]